MADNKALLKGRALLLTLLSLCAFAVPFLVSPAPAKALGLCATIEACVQAARLTIMGFHAAGEEAIMNHTEDEFGDHQKKDFSATEGQKPKSHEEWMINVFFKQHVVPALKRLTTQLNVVSLQQSQMTGDMMNADMQMQTQRLYKKLETQAEKDYQPSEGLLCQAGTNVRALGASESQGRLNAAAMSGRALARQLGAEGTAGAETADQDIESRWKLFTTTYCDPHANNGDTAKPNTGMALACSSGASDPKRRNIDVDYTRLIEDPRTLDVNFLDASVTDSEQDVVSFATNVFGSTTLTRQMNDAKNKKQEGDHLRTALRSVAAKRNVAQNSFNAVVGMKSSGKADQGSTREYLAAIMKELDVPEDEIYGMIGENPSYYAQMEIMAKRLYQTPSFYAGLYDKPANVDRSAVALKAIDLMLDRAMYESQLRREMVLSVLLSSELKQTSDAAGRALQP